MKLYLDTSNDILIIGLLNNDKIIDLYSENAARQLTEKTIPSLKKFLVKHNLQLNNFTDFYVNVGPGSYTGVRVALTIIKAIFGLNSNINVYVINSLLFQVGVQKCISIIDAKGGMKYFAVYNLGQEIIPPQLLSIENVNIISKNFSDYQTIADYQIKNIKKNLVELIPFFVKIDDVYNLEPHYIKKAI